VVTHTSYEELIVSISTPKLRRDRNTFPSASFIRHDQSPYQLDRKIKRSRGKVLIDRIATIKYCYVEQPDAKVRYYMTAIDVRSCRDTGLIIRVKGNKAA
jgi:hypothetical protein